MKQNLFLCVTKLGLHNNFWNFTSFHYLTKYTVIYQLKEIFFMAIRNFFFAWYWSQCTAIAIEITLTLTLSWFFSVLFQALGTSARFDSEEHIFTYSFGIKFFNPTNQIVKLRPPNNKLTTCFFQSEFLLVGVGSYCVSHITFLDT